MHHEYKLHDRLSGLVVSRFMACESETGFLQSPDGGCQGVDLQRYKDGQKSVKNWSCFHIISQKYH